MISSKFRAAACLSGLILLTSCSRVVEPILLPELTPEQSLQEQFDIKVAPLTFEVAKELNAQAYDRLVSRPGDAFSANVISETLVLRKNFPPDDGESKYLLGIGDEVSLIQNLEPNSTVTSFDSLPPSTVGGAADLSGLITRSKTASVLTTKTELPEIVSPNPVASNIISTSGRIGSDGSLLLIGIGRLEAAGREISHLRDEVRSVLIRNGKSPDFQLEIKAFNSQKAYLTQDAYPGKDLTSFVLPITDQRATLRELIAGVGVVFDERVLTTVKIQRNGETYAFTLADLFSEEAPDIFLKNKDHIFIQRLNYVAGRVFLVGGIEPTVLLIRPEERQTLAEVLVSKNGPMAVATAQRSAVYLLRGNNPLRAYHLDAQNPARILVADAVELRPNDIVFVGEQPITTFNRVLSTIFPLRIFSRDIKDNNIP
jgi:polysaccharide export outer membrane protein